MIDFKDISIRGRIAYGTMCAENLALACHPERNWTLVFERLWSISQDDKYWDAWASEVIDILPELVLSDEPYTDEPDCTIDPAMREKLRELYAGMPDSWGVILSDIVDIEEASAFTQVEGCGAEELELLEHVVSVLQSEDIELPDPDAVAFSRFSENGGRGDGFDARKLSRVI